MYDTPVVCLLVVLFAGIILVMLSRLSQTRTVTVYKYLPRDLDTWLRESPYASVSQNRLFAADDWSTVQAVSRVTPTPTAVVRTGGLFSGMSHTKVPGT